MRPNRQILGLLALVSLAGAATAVARGRADRFDHWRHRSLFVTCQSCHAGIQDTTQAVWPTQESCATCHDGTTERTVDWQPPEYPPNNLRFTHTGHIAAVIRDAGRDSTVACMTCHGDKGAPWMRVQRVVIRQCLDCHGQAQDHLTLADNECGRCHVPLARATALSREQIAAFPRPPSHDAPDFAQAAHGKLAEGAVVRGQRVQVAPSCATCHARDFCLSCHVDAPENRAIQALAPDPRSTVIKASLVAPASHRSDNFLSLHGDMVKRDPAQCRTCHTRQSCTVCHTGQTNVASALYAAGPGRATGAVVEARRPPTHVPDFRNNHKALAEANPESCASCHARAECLDCHRPTAASSGGYHRTGFLTTHPAAAYSRQASCADCHNTRQFCTNCHLQSGLTAKAILRAGFHDSKQFFLLGHGQAARQSLETCVSCHAERDCLQCHSAFGGRRFNPHGPGFDADRLRKKNPEMCTV
ncbi:MAG: cytochrome c3 family protein, partial [Gemmatimonadales bacterium]